MDRRNFLHFSSTAGVLYASGLAGLPALASAAPVTAGWRRFELTTEVTVSAPGDPTRIWIPVPYAQGTPYQRHVQTRFQIEGGHAELVGARGDTAHMVAAQWPEASAVRRITVTSQVETRNVRVDLSRPPPPGLPAEHPDTLRHYLRPTVLLPTDGIVKETADRITQGRHDPIEKARAIYAWVVQNTCRTASTPGCGIGDVRYMLTANDLNGKCADINALFVALARASGIPARDAYGVRVTDSEFGYNSLGKAGDITKAQHCRAEFYAAGYGWIPVDPADVRKVMLEEKPGDLPIDHPKVRAAQVMLFGAWEMNWVAYNHDHDVVLPGTRHGPIPFLMYPQGETANGRLDSLDPEKFRYRISSRRLET